MVTAKDSQIDFFAFFGDEKSTWDNLNLGSDSRGNCGKQQRRRSGLAVARPTLHGTDISEVLK